MSAPDSAGGEGLGEEERRISTAKRGVPNRKPLAANRLGDLTGRHFAKGVPLQALV